MADLNTSDVIGAEMIRQLGSRAFVASEEAARIADAFGETSSIVKARRADERFFLAVSACLVAQDALFSRFREALTDARKFVQAELDMRINKHTIGGDMRTLNERDSGIVGEAMDCLARLDGALAPTLLQLQDSRANEDTEDDSFCEACHKRIEQDRIVSSGGCDFCPECFAAWEVEFKKCEHAWEPAHDPEHGDPGRYCDKCGGFSPDDIPAALQDIDKSARVDVR